MCHSNDAVSDNADHIGSHFGSTFSVCFFMVAIGASSVLCSSGRKTSQEKSVIDNSLRALQVKQIIENKLWATNKNIILKSLGIHVLIQHDDDTRNGIQKCSSDTDTSSLWPLNKGIKTIQFTSEKRKNNTLGKLCHILYRHCCPNNTNSEQSLIWFARILYVYFWSDKKVIGVIY